MHILTNIYINDNFKSNIVINDSVKFAMKK